MLTRTAYGQQSVRWGAVIGLLAAVLAGTGLLAAPPAWALPEDPKIVEGSGTVERINQQTLQVTASDRSIIEFSSFNIGSSESVIYILPAQTATTLSRVTGGSASEILGRLSANGILFLVNPSGIAFGSSAIVQTAGLVASTLPINNADFLAGQYRFDAAHQETLAAVVNKGSITTRDGGFAVLVGGAVENTGTISAPLGTVALASGQAVTVGLSGDNQVAIVIELPVAKQVMDAQGKPLTAQLTNTGTLAADGGHVVLTAQAANKLFDLAINQDGMIRADAVVVGQGGTIDLVASGPIRSVGGLSAAAGRIHVESQADVLVGGDYQAPQGSVEVTAGRDIAIVSPTRTAGTTTFTANRDIAVDADLTTDSGNLTLAADADLDGVGRFLQAPGTTVATTTFGDITISASGASTLANVRSAGALTLKRAGAPVTYTQYPGSSVTTAGSMILQPGVTLEALTTTYQVGRGWSNLGVFDPGTSSVWLVGPEPATIQGETIFYNFGSTQPGKLITFEPTAVQAIVNTTTFQGDVGALIRLHSSIPGQQFGLLPHGETILKSVDFQDAWIRGPPVTPLLSKNSGNNLGLDFSLTGPVWTGASLSPDWSDPNSWDGGFVPGAFDVARLTNRSPQNAIVDGAFAGTIGGLILQAGYAGTLSLARDLTITGDVTLAGGTLAAGSQTLTVGGNWTRSNGTFEAGTSTVVFTDASQPSTILGSTTFHNFTSATTDKVLRFEQDKVQTILGTWTIQGAEGGLVQLLSSQEGSQWYVDPQGPRDIAYAWVKDAYNLSPEEVHMIQSTNRGNCYNWDAVRTWSGTVSNVWNLAGNWLENVVPVAKDDLVFPDNLVSGRYATSNTIAAATTFASVSINGTGYTLAGNSITVGVGNITTNKAAGANTIGLNMAFGATRTVTVTNNNETLTISGVISGAGFGLTKAGPGTLTLSAANSFTGLTTISAGTLQYGVNNALSSGAVTVSGGTLNLGSFTDTVGAVTLISGTLTGTTGVLTGTSYAVRSGTISAILAGAGALTKTTAGTVILSAANTYTGLTIISAGTLQYGVNNALSTGAVIVSGGTLNLVNFTDTVGAVTLISGTLTGTTGVLTGTSYAVRSGTISAILAGAGALTKTTAGTVTLSGVNTRTGVTTISAGVLSVATIGNGGVAGNLGAATNAAANLVLGGGTLQYTGSTASTDRNFTLTAATTSTFDIPLAGTTLTLAGASTNTTGALTKTGAGTLTLSGANLYTGLTTVSAGTLQYGINNALASGAVTVSGGTLNLSSFTDTVGVVTLASGTLTSTTGIVTGTSYAVQSGTISAILAGAGALTKTTAGTVTLSGVNTYAGGTTLSAGTLNVNHATAIGTGTFTISGGTIDNTSAGAITLTNNNAQNWNGDFTFTGTQNLNLGTGAVTLGANRQVTGSGGNLTVGGIISGAGFSLTKAGTGTLTLSGANTYTGATTVSAGVLNAQTASALGSTTNGTSVTSGAALELQGGISVGAEALTLNGSGISSGGALRNISGTNSWAGAMTLGAASTIASDAGTLTLSGLMNHGGFGLTLTGAGDTTFSGSVSGSGNLTKSGTGTLQRTSSPLALGGALIISAGTFDANGQPVTVTGLATVSGGTYLASTATQTFNGGLTISGGAFIGSSGAMDVNGPLTLSAGTLTAPAGTLTISGDFSQGGGTFLHNSGTVELDGADQSLSSSMTFNNLTKTATTAQTLTLPAGETQTVIGTLTLKGAAGARLSLRSSTDGIQWEFDPQGTRTMDFLDVKDAHNVNAIPIPTSGFNIVNSGNNIGWGFVISGTGGTGVITLGNPAGLSQGAISSAVRLLGSPHLIGPPIMLVLPGGGAVILLPAAPMMPPIPLAEPAVPAATELPPTTTVPTPTAEVPSVTAGGVGPQPAVEPHPFTGASGAAVVPPAMEPEAFQGATGAATLPILPTPEIFLGAQGSAQMSQELPSVFQGISGAAYLPPPTP